MKYKYKGKTAIKIYGVGIVQPVSEFESDKEIIHPLISKVETKSSKKKEELESKEK